MSDSGLEELPVILIVDDDDTTRMMLKMMLEGKHRGNLTQVKVATVSDGASCISALRTRAIKPVLIIIDALMPGINGFDLTKQLQADGIYKGPIFMLTALTGSDARNKAMGVGCTHFITKPVSPLKLYEDIVTFVPELLMQTA